MQDSGLGLGSNITTHRSFDLSFYMEGKFKETQDLRKSNMKSREIFPLLKYGTCPHCHKTNSG